MSDINVRFEVTYLMMLIIVLKSSTWIVNEFMELEKGKIP